MQKLISFTIKSEKGFLKKPDINDGIYLTYNMLHKPAILGILGSIIGLEGFKKNGVLPEYYKKLKNILIGVKPVGDEKGNFAKTRISYNNTTGFASDEEGGNLIISEQTLIKPAYQIYLLLNLKNEYQNQIYLNVKNQEAVFLPYLGKNDYSLWWDKKNVQEYEFEKIQQISNFKINTIFKKSEPVTKCIVKVMDRKSLAAQKNNFFYFENLPISYDEKFFQYKMCNFAYTNAELKDQMIINSESLFKIKKMEEVIFLY